MNNTNNEKSTDTCIQTLQAELVKNQNKQLGVIAQFFENFESYEEGVKFLFEVQKCTFTSPRFEAQGTNDQENIKIWLPTLMEFVMDLGMLTSKKEMLTLELQSYDS